jgi:Chaperone of endosialidase
MNPPIQSKNTSICPLLIPLALACFALLPAVQATDLDSVLPGNNTADGFDVLVNLAGGTANSGFGFEALNQDTTGDGNTATGFSALKTNTTGDFNTANGDDALFANTTGDNNTASGASALSTNTTGDFNTANGVAALFSNTTGSLNTASGNDALAFNTTGEGNTAMGFQALFSNTTGVANTAVGRAALFSNTSEGFFSGIFNTAVGDGALSDNTTGSLNTASGFRALAGNTTGVNNIALGGSAGFNLTTGSHNIDIGNQGVAAESNTIRIGTERTHTKTFVAGINGAGVMGVAVKVNAAGQLGTAPSSARFKQNVKPMDKASEAIHALKPVTFHYKKELDPEGTPQFGLVAEEVEKVNPDLVVRDAEGKVYTVRYEAVNAMLLNEFLKAHRKIEEQGAMIAQQQKQIEALSAGLQKVSAQIEASKPAPQVVENNQ